MPDPRTTRPPVSVAMASYNGAAYVADQVRSILAQLGADDELVIVALHHQHRKPGYWRPRLAKVRG